MRLPLARATTIIAVVTAAISLAIIAGGLTDQSALRLGFVPARIAHPGIVPGALPVWLTPLGATLVHEGFLHLGFNLLMLGYCGRFVEPAVGPGGIVTLYGVGAYAAAAAQYAAGGGFDVMVGASGAISAIVGAYALLYGRRVPRLRSPLLSHLAHVAWLAAAWVGVQLLVGFSGGPQGQPVAAAAHVGGFVVGLLLARPLLRWRYRKA